MKITLKLSRKSPHDLEGIEFGQHKAKVERVIKRVIDELESDFRDSNIDMDIDFIQLTHENYIYTKEIRAEFTAVADDEKETTELAKCVDCVHFLPQQDDCGDGREQGTSSGQHRVIFNCEGFKNRKVKGE